jgi:DnaJ-class molecular chaperone
MFGGTGRASRAGGFGGGFGGGRGQSSDFDPYEGRLDVEASLTISLEDSVKGAEKRLRLPTGKELNVRIPAGVIAGRQIRLKGQGQEVPGHKPGDVLITIAIAPHPFFKVDGADLRADLSITLYDAVLGGKVRVPTLDGAVQLSIPKNTSSGRTFRLKGKGLPSGSGHGDLLVTTQIMLPKMDDPELATLMEHWRGSKTYDPS